MSTLMYVVTLVLALGSGLNAGVFAAFSTFVMPGLARLPPAQGVAAMQSINAAALTPPFLGLFVGTAAGCAVVALSSFWRWRQAGAVHLLVGSALYLLGPLLVTAACNVPKNEALAALDANSAAAVSAWARYLPGWTAWNHLRAVAALAATASFILALRR
jgi:uncharacterized membrane protein